MARDRKAYRAANRERINAYQRKYYAALDTEERKKKREYSREYMRKYRAANREKVLSQQRKSNARRTAKHYNVRRYALHREELKARARNYYQANRTRLRAESATRQRNIRKRKKLQLTPAQTRALVAAVKNATSKKAKRK